MSDGMLPPVKRKRGATARARRLRRDETEAEYRLWGDLRNRLLNGFKFSRQIPIGPYFADFICRETSLVVEIEGGQHSESPHDLVRTKFLNENGYSVLRFWNDEVLRERRAVLETVLAALEGRLAPSPGLRFAPATLSPRGEEVDNPERRGASKRIWLKGNKRADFPPLPTGERVAGAKRRPGEGGSI
jgi:very-short-patch-repair endonuclease